MRVEIIELLRCPAAHEPTALVTVANARKGDRLIDGTLGCVVCGAEYALREGVAYLAAVAPDSRVMVSASREEPVAADHAVDGMRTAALLGLSEPGRRVVLCGANAAAAHALATDTGALCVTVNASPAVRREVDADHLMIGAAVRIPLADVAVAALAVDAAHVGVLGDATRVVRRGGRVLAPSHAPVPDGCVELARDAQEWVAEVAAVVSTPIELRSARATS